MNLIAYSDSEGSDNEAPPAPIPAAKSALKPSFQKVVDRANPGKIKLNLPTPSHSRTEKDHIQDEAPPAKKARTGGGAFSGFNAMLPAPKKPNVSAVTENEGSTTGKRGLGKGLGAGVNLRTGAEPAFKRESRVDEEYDEHGNPVKKADTTPKQKEDFRALFNLPPPKIEKRSAPPQTDTPTPEPVAKPVAKSKFMPLSVARGKKKKPVVPRTAVAASEDSKSASVELKTVTATDLRPPAKKRVSLFSVGVEEDAAAKGKPSGEYQPMLYGVGEEDDAQIPEEAFDESNTYHAGHYQPAAAASSVTPGGEELTNIASELNLSAAERRQLFGRKGQGPDLSAANIIEFNTDTEYAHNEQLRQQGETVQHNALKSISGTGKNNLRSLINVAATQKDALEEHFATGRRNRREAGSKYGW